MENTFERDAFLVAASYLKKIQGNIKYLKEVEKEASSKLRDLCGNESRRYNGYEYKMIERKGSVKYALIPELKNVDLEKYRSEMVTYWKLNFTEQFDV